MRVALVTPYFLPALRGNSITVDRLARGLSAAGDDVRVFPLGGGCEVPGEIAAFDPDLIHGFHALRGGGAACEAAGLAARPYVVTLTGSDVYESLVGSDRVRMLRILDNAAAIVAFHDSALRELVSRAPALEGKCRVIPQGVAPLPGHFPCPFPFGEEETVFFLPAGLRPVKNVLFPLSPLRELLTRGRRLALLLAGPVLDETYAGQVMKEFAGCSFARYAGEVPHLFMGSLYRRSGVVLNTSLFEGGMANAILEGMACGKAVLAADIPGNRSVVEEGVTGFLYRDAAEFASQAERLMDDPELCLRLGENGRQRMRDNHDPALEADRYRRLYRDVLAGRAGS